MAESILSIIKKGDSYKIIYSAKNFKSGLVDIIGVSHNPTDNVESQFQLTEISNSGVYTYVWDSIDKDIGIWTFIINSISNPAPSFTRIQVIDPLTQSGTPWENINNILISIDVLQNKINNLNDQLTNISANVTAVVTAAQNAALAAQLTNKMQSGRWKIANNQLTFFDNDNITPLITFNLLDQNGNPTMINPVERKPV
jgi:hypothetical protein